MGSDLFKDMPPLLVAQSDPRSHTHSTGPLLPPPLGAMPPFRKEALRLDTNFLVREFLIWP